MKNVICIVPVSPVRLTPDHRVEMSSQLLFGETAEVLNRNDEGWLFIKHSWDGYEGWCRENQFVFINEPFEDAVEYTGDWVDDIYMNGQKLMIPFGSSLSVLKHNIPGIKIEFNGNIYNAARAVISDEKIIEIASLFLNTAYLWGGRSVFGIDCSGFVQSVYRMFNVPILRDARDQVEQGRVIDTLDEAV
ncbi:MAG TPA: NlpC/P60 family protein, partial [Ferruginibacter sp.]|nr:NlpC/P60 family protein [Ferruginibacter sp.]